MAAPSDKPSISSPGRYFGSSVGIENPTPAYNAIHDNTSQEKGFLYLSTVIDPTSRLTLISGVSNGAYQIPNNPGQTPAFTAVRHHQASIPRCSTSGSRSSTSSTCWPIRSRSTDFDFQLSYFNRYSSLHFMPDPIGDLVFNGVASDVYRQSFINGIQEDTSYRLGFAHTLKFGFSASTENSLVNNGSTALPARRSALPIDMPTSVFDSNTKTGYLFSTYLEDEWKVNNQLTVNAGLRFDQMWQFVDANQLSPRINATWKPYDGTTFHAGYSRNFTPPEQVLAVADQSRTGAGHDGAASRSRRTIRCSRNAPTSTISASIRRSTRSPGSRSGSTPITRPRPICSTTASSARPMCCPRSTTLAARMSASNSRPTTPTAICMLYGNVAWARQRATQIVSNQYLFAPDELAYIANAYVYTDHAQLLTASAGASYLWNGTQILGRHDLWQRPA